jgi:hypothetical protein
MYGFGYSIGNAKVSQGVSYDADASAYFAAVPNALSTADKAIFNTLFLNK